MRSSPHDAMLWTASPSLRRSKTTRQSIFYILSTIVVYL